jgi:hypothetical protein
MGASQGGVMEKNQTAAELAKEYEQLAIAATNDYCRLKRHEPESAFSALTKQISFCTTMHVFWISIARRLAAGPEMYSRGKEVDWPTDDNSPYDEYGV